MGAVADPSAKAATLDTVKMSVASPSTVAVAVTGTVMAPEVLTRSTLTVTDVWFSSMSTADGVVVGK